MFLIGGENVKVYSPGEIAKLLNVKESTLRKYSILLEKTGYTFQRNNQKQRWYSDNDVIALQKLVTLKNNADMSLKDCAESVYLWAKGGNVTQELPVTDNDTERYNNDITQMKELILKQNELIGELFNRLDRQQQYIENRLNQQEELLKKSINDSQEQQKMIVEIAEEKRGIFSRFFKKSNE